MTIWDLFKKKQDKKKENTEEKPLTESQSYAPVIANKKDCEMGRNERAMLVLSGIMTGDMIGHPYEGLFEIPYNIDPDHDPLIRQDSGISDDTVMSYAVLQAALEIAEGFPMSRGDRVALYRMNLKKYAKSFPDAGYGMAFYNWAVDDGPEYTSYGNGGAMRAGVIGAVFDDIEDVIENAICSALPSHGHPEGIKGAVVTAVLVWMGFHGATRMEMLAYACKHYSEGFWNIETYQKTIPLNPDASIEELQDLAGITVSLSSWITVPETVVNFMHSKSFDGCMRNILRYASDSDTVGAISGGIAAAYYKSCRLVIDEDNTKAEEIRNETLKKLKAAEKKN